MELAIGLYKRHLIKGLTAWAGKRNGLPGKQKGDSF